MTSIHPAFFQVALVWIIASLHPNNASSTNRDNYRLPKYIIPIAYIIKLTIKSDFPENRSFGGYVEIYFETKDYPVGAPIILNGKDLRITEAQLNNEPVLVETNSSLDRLVVQNTVSVDVSKINLLKLKYTGKINKDFSGLYADSYKEGNERVWYLATFLQPLGARRLFPCLDEPAFKAVFRVTVRYPNQYQVLSNTESKAERIIQYERETTFQDTPIMSTYLLAIVISQFEHVAQEKNGITFRIWYRKGLAHMHEEALYVIRNRMLALEMATGVKYLNAADGKIRKMEQVALPGFWEPGSLEFWGLILYTEDSLLWQKDQSPRADQDTLHITVAHNLAHMWFGNKKTCAWWNSLWLKEGFATYMSYYAQLDGVVLDALIVERIQKLMTYDVSTASVPLTLPEDDVLKPDEIATQFNVLNSIKGAAVLQMMKKFMNLLPFYAGVYSLMDKRSSNIITPKYLWDSWDYLDLSRILPVNTTLETVMREWTESKGYPVVNVSRRGSLLKLTAQRLVYQVSEKDSTHNIWYIPITYTTWRHPKSVQSIKSNTWIKKTDALILREDMSQERSWIVVNSMFTAYIRVNYDRDLWKALEKALEDNQKQFSVSNRAQIVDDALQLAFLGKLSYSIALSVVQYLKDELHRPPWYAAIRGFNAFRRRLDSKEVVGYLNDFIRPLFWKYYHSFANSSYGKSNAINQGFTKSVGCGIGYTSCIRKMTQRFEDFIEKNIEVEPDLRFTAYCWGLRSKNGIKHWNALYNRLGATNIPTEVNTLIKALGCVQNKDILKMYLEKTLNESSCIRYGQRHLVLMSVAHNSKRGTDVALDFLVGNIKQILKRYPHFWPIVVVLKTLGDTVRTREQLQKLEEFAKTSEMAKYSKQMQQVITHIKESLAWTEEQKKNFVTELRSRIRYRSIGSPLIVKNALFVISVLVNVMNTEICF